MGDNNPMEITVTTQFNEDLIRQITDMGNRRIQEGVIRLREQGVREALVKLGWTPPDGDAFLEGVKAGLEAAKEAVAKEGMRPHDWDDDYGFGLERALAVVASIDPTTIKPKEEAEKKG